GNSPARGDTNREGTPPTAGSPPYAMVYRDPRGFADRIRSLAIAVVNTDAGKNVLAPDALALAAMMNFDTGLNGQAQNVNINADFARWVLGVTIHRLRPRYIVGVGLAGFLLQPRHRWLLDLFSTYVG